MASTVPTAAVPATVPATAAAIPAAARNDNRSGIWISGIIRVFIRWRIITIRRSVGRIHHRRWIIWSAEQCIAENGASNGTSYDTTNTDVVAGAVYFDLLLLLGILSLCS